MKNSHCYRASEYCDRQWRGLCPAGSACRSRRTGRDHSCASSEKMMLKNNWRASKLMGLDVYNEANEKLGDINELILDKNGKVNAVVIGVGGFLGMGEHDIAVTMDKLKFMEEPVRTSSARDHNARIDDRYGDVWSARIRGAESVDVRPAWRRRLGGGLRRGSPSDAGGRHLRNPPRPSGPGSASHVSRRVSRRRSRLYPSTRLTTASCSTASTTLTLRDARWCRRSNAFSTHFTDGSPSESCRSSLSPMRGCPSLPPSSAATLSRFFSESGSGWLSENPLEQSPASPGLARAPGSCCCQRA